MFEIPKVQEFPVSYSFEAVVGLPDYQGLPSVMQYSPSWQVRRQTIALVQYSFGAFVTFCFVSDHFLDLAKLALID